MDRAVDDQRDAAQRALDWMLGNRPHGDTLYLTPSCYDAMSKHIVIPPHVKRGKPA